MHRAKNEQSPVLENQLYQIRRNWSPEVYRRRRRGAAALQRALLQVVLRSSSKTIAISEAG